MRRPGELREDDMGTENIEEVPVPKHGLFILLSGFGHPKSVF